MIWIWAIVILVFLIAGYVIFNLLKKVENYEDSIEKLSEQISQRDDFFMKICELIKVSDEKIKRLDDNATFSGDDEIGFFFSTVRDIQQYMTAYKNSFEDFKK